MERDRPNPPCPIDFTAVTYRKFLSNRIGASKRDIWTRAGNVIAPSLKYKGHVELTLFRQCVCFYRTMLHRADH